MAAALAAALPGCALWGGKSAPKPTPADLGANVPLLGVKQAWSARVNPPGKMPLEIQAQGALMAIPSDDAVTVLDARTGREVWRAPVAEGLSAGAGFDGSRVAVVLRSNVLATYKDGKELWRQRLSGSVYTSPLVAGGRVFVATADKTLAAYDADTGRRLWSQQRSGEPLVLRQAGVLVPSGNTLLAGAGGRLFAVNPDNGNLLWDSPLAVPRGTNDVERLVELVGRTSRHGTTVCARAFQAAVGCVDVSRAATVWAVAASGAQGVDGDADKVYATEANGAVVAFARRDGARVWSTDRLKHRQLTAPLVLGRSVVVGDESGLVHLLSREDGSPLNRLTTDGSGIAAAPVVAGDTLVVLTRSGALFGFRPE
ncbi:outer membrane protein assembly factor BamB [Acidovorax lacteus]|uniref:Outer membrane protein assembly factor BamB n=1 Tax=Acidovorax lacteus TaxID=1924988 RepID=A0ABP8KX81_9BURK